MSKKKGLKLIIFEGDMVWKAWRMRKICKFKRLAKKTNPITIKHL